MHYDRHSWRIQRGQPLLLRGLLLIPPSPKTAPSPSRRGVRHQTLQGNQRDRAILLIKSFPSRRLPLPARSTVEYPDEEWLTGRPPSATATSATRASGRGKRFVALDRLACYLGTETVEVTRSAKYALPLGSPRRIFLWASAWIITGLSAGWWQASNEGPVATASWCTLSGIARGVSADGSRDQSYLAGWRMDRSHHRAFRSGNSGLDYSP